MSHEFHTLVRAPANIAWVKYWGKKGPQLPANPSLSMTLKECATLTDFTATPAATFQLEFWFEDSPNPAFELKIRHYLEGLFTLHPTLAKFRYKIQSRNTFPHSSGIASSASSYAALALALARLLNADEKTAGSLARLGSGSACRSLVEGYGVWGETALVPGSSDLHAVTTTAHAEFSQVRDTVLIVSSREKEVSSRAGHKQMGEHPFKTARYQQANSNFESLWNGLQSGDWSVVGDIIEAEALTLHALMLSQTPGYILLEPNSLEIIRLVRLFRQESKLPVYFTIDAGPNIHLIYPEVAHAKVEPFIRHELLRFTEQGAGAIWDGLGEGAR
jgi:diphosphomevalonate decarboxylase